MKKTKIVLLLGIIFLTGIVWFSCSGKKEQVEKGAVEVEISAVSPKTRIDLFNGVDFTGWKLFIPDPAVDVKSVWQVQNGIIHCTGTPNGYMRTETDVTNYKLHLEWRWPEEPGNSGVLLHMREPDKVWPKSIECQLQSGDAGDFWLIDGTDIKEHMDKSSRRIPKKLDSSENPPGEWNVYDIICRGNTIQAYVNGVLQNEGTEATVSAGKVCLQSEGKPIEFRNIYVEPL